MIEITMHHYLFVAGLLFLLGMGGVFLGRKSLIRVLISIEVMLLSINLNFVTFSAHLNDLAGQVFTVFILTVAAAEAAIGLAIVVIYYRRWGTIDVQNIQSLKG